MPDPITFFDATGVRTDIDVSSARDKSAIIPWSSKWLASGKTYAAWMIDDVVPVLKKNSRNRVMISNPLGVWCNRGMSITAPLQLIDAGVFPEPALVHNVNASVAKMFDVTWYVGMREPTQFQRLDAMKGAGGRSIGQTVLDALTWLYAGGRIVVDSYSDMMNSARYAKDRAAFGENFGVEAVPKASVYNAKYKKPCVVVTDGDREKFFRGPEFVQPTQASEYIVIVHVGTRDQINERVKAISQEPGVTPCILAEEV